MRRMITVLSIVILATILFSCEQNQKSNINQDRKIKLKDKIRKEMINQVAPNFSLTDLAGKTISLKDLRGKTVVIDFWATWCGPCIASFPGMQKAIDKFKNDESIKFLFINTGERGEAIEKRVVDFIKEKNYPFHVLLDLKNNVAAAYNVEGIPTKFVVDKDGKIRFKKVGFESNTDKMVEELSLMIEMVK